MSDETTRNFNLTLTQISAGAFAATAAAALGSQLGVAGTVVGAALGSVTTNVVSAVYQHSLERSRERVQAIAVRAARDSSTDGRDAADPPVAVGRRMALAVGALAAFVLSLVAITGVEAFRGEPLSGGAGTTVGKVIDGAGRQGGAPVREPAEPTGTTAPTVTTTVGENRVIIPSTISTTPVSPVPTSGTTSAPLITTSNEISTPAPSPPGTSHQP